MNKKLLTGLATVAVCTMSMCFDTTPSSAQSSCQGAINTVTQDIKNKGTTVDSEFDSEIYTMSKLGRVNSMRKNEVAFILDTRFYDSSAPRMSRSAYHIANNILNSPVLMNSYSTQIKKNCNGVGMVSFALHSTDFVVEFLIRDNGQLGYHICKPFLNDSHTIMYGADIFGPSNQYDVNECAYVVADF